MSSPEGIVKLLTLFGGCEDWWLFRKWSAGVGGVMLADGVVSVS